MKAIVAVAVAVAVIVAVTVTQQQPQQGLANLNGAEGAKLIQMATPK
jgi:hypothetical protein